MKNKILLILVLCVFALFWDDLAMRVAHLEYEGRDNLYRRARLAALEKEAQKIPVLEQQVAQLQQRLLILNPLLAKSNLAAQRLTLIQDLLDKTVLADKKIKVFRTSQHPDRVEAAGIGSNIAQRQGKWGGHTFFRVGSVDPGNVGRGLLQFAELTPEFFKGKKILAAVLYMKQTQNDATLEDDNALNETIDLYAVKKKWSEGTYIRGKAAKGFVTWMSARADIEDWTVPGCSSPTDDFDPLILGTTGPAVSGDATEWIMLVFNIDGIAYLMDTSSLYKGFLLKTRIESKMNTAVFFDSDEGPAEYIPYLEIYYQDDKSKTERR
ncbi:MAG: hypothetical protein IT395_01805 [Candidatus Omnitrophica bacterium]|nr:hypothetical protein [Candidatus Omnitrophota bacterium]